MRQLLIAYISRSECSPVPPRGSIRVWGKVANQGWRFARWIGSV